MGDLVPAGGNRIGRPLRRVEIDASRLLNARYGEDAGAGAGVFAVTRIEETRGVYLDAAERSPDTIAARWDEISQAASFPLEDALSQTRKFAELARLAEERSAS